MPNYNFFQSIKPPKTNALDMYNKIVYDKIKDRLSPSKRSEKKPPLPLFKKLLRGNL